MKKYLTMLLALVMCLSLAACGTKVEVAEGVKVDVSNYADLLIMMENEEYGEVISYVAALAAEKNQDPEEEPVEVLPEIFGTWYLRNNNDKEDYAQVVFNEDGSCTLGDQKMTWVLNHEGENSVGLDIFKGETLSYGASLSISERSGLPLLSIGGRDKIEYHANYVKNEILNTLFVSWRQLDRTDETVDEYFSVGDYGVTIGETEYNYKVVTMEETQVVLELYPKNSDTAAFGIDLGFRGDYPVLTLTDKATGAAFPYYCENFGFDETWPEVRYWRAMNVLEDAADGYSVWPGWLELEKSLSNYEALAYAMELFGQCKDYKDSAEHLKRFTVLEDKLTSVREVTTDKLGNVDDYESGNYTYDANDHLLSGSDYEMGRLFYGVYDSSYRFNYEYDEKGLLTRITQGWSKDISAILTPSYDASGNMVSLHVQNNSGEFTNLYTYDASGNLTRAEYYSVDSPDTVKYYCDYTYDGSGNLIRANGFVAEYWNKELYNCDYTYDGSGKLVQKVEEYTYDSDWSGYVPCTKTYSYSYDEEGKMISAVYNNTRETTYSSRVYNYIYQDLYFYDYPTE